VAISVTQIIPELLKECPELQRDWEEYSAWKERGSGEGFLSGAWLYLVIQNLHRAGDTGFFPRFFGVLERFIVEGDAEVKSLACDGFLKGLHKSISFSIKPGPEAFAAWMRPGTRRHWQQLSEAKTASDKQKDADEEEGRRRALLFRLRPARLWGDYGSSLMRGSASRDEESGKLLLDRAGPFAPPIFFPLVRGGFDVRSSGYCAVVTESFRKLLEDAGLGKLTFKPAIKRKIVDLPWHTWDRLVKFPAGMPKSGGLGGFIEGREHSTKAAEEMEDLWELLVPGIQCEITEDQSEDSMRPSDRGYIISPAADIYRGLFTPSKNPHFWLVDEPTRLWFEQHAGEWVRFTHVFGA
jgi:hypothetical protein